LSVITTLTLGFFARYVALGGQSKAAT